MDQEKYGKEYMKEYVDNTQNTNKTMSAIRISLWLQNYRFQLKNRYNWQNAAKYYNETILSCTFNQSPCKESDFKIYYDVTYGLCYQFNGRQTLETNGQYKQVSKEDGKVGGLQMDVYIGTSKKILLERGVHLIVRQNNRENSSFNEGIDIGGGAITNVAVRRKNIINLPEPYNECLNLKKINDFDSDLYKETFKYFNSYRQM